MRKSTTRSGVGSITGGLVGHSEACFLTTNVTAMCVSSRENVTVSCREYLEAVGDEDALINLVTKPLH